MNNALAHGETIIEHRPELSAISTGADQFHHPPGVGGLAQPGTRNPGLLETSTFVPPVGSRSSSKAQLQRSGHDLGSAHGASSRGVLAPGTQAVMGTSLEQYLAANRSASKN